MSPVITVMRPTMGWLGPAGGARLAAWHDRRRTLSFVNLQAEELMRQLDGGVEAERRRNAIDRRSGDDTDEEVGLTMFAPFMRHRCCLGCLTLDHGALLIAFIETVLLAIFVLQSLYLVTNDGLIFYTRELVGWGNTIGLTIAVFTTTGVASIVCLILAVKRRSPLLLTPHILFQWLTVGMLLGMCALIYDRTKVHTPAPHRIRFPSGCVLIVSCFIPAFLLGWWSLVLVDLWLQLFRYIGMPQKQLSELNNNLADSKSSRSSTPQRPCYIDELPSASVVTAIATDLEAADADDRPTSTAFDTNRNRPPSKRSEGIGPLDCISEFTPRRK